MLTFTSAHGSHDVAPTAAPRRSICGTIGEGLAEAHGWEPRGLRRTWLT